MQDIANLIWALTRLESRDGLASQLDMLAKLCSLAQQQISHLEPQDCAVDSRNCEDWDCVLYVVGVLNKC